MNGDSLRSLPPRQANQLAVLLDAVVLSDPERTFLTWLARPEAHTVKAVAR